MMRMSIHQRRRILSRIALGFCAASALFGLFWLALILFTLAWKGGAGLNLAVFTQMTPPPGQAGGLLNALFGSFALTALATLLGTPIGVLAGTYMAEYGRGTWLATLVRFVNDILLSAPSIVIGLFVYQVMVAPVGHFSGWAGIVALSLIVVPIVVRTTEDMLLLVPDGLREAAAALGAARAVMIRHNAYRAARTGILTGILLAIARISGETAPLLFTALSNQFWSANLSRPIASLPIAIYEFALSPYKEWQQLAWTGALILTLAVLGLSVAVRAAAARRETKWT
jgi:phosphate transport system permease protein